MNALAEKIEIIQWIAGLNDTNILQLLKKIKDSAKPQDWWGNISVAERQSVEKGLEDSKNGKVTPHSDVRKKYEKWL